MRNLLYIAQVDLSQKDAYSKKIYNQIKTIVEKNISVALICLYKNNSIGEFIFFKKFKRQKTYNLSISFLKKIILRLALFYYAYIKLVNTKYRFIYYRYPRADLFLFLFLIFVRLKYFNKIKILSEIPTYPYNFEIQLVNFSLKNYYIYLSDLIFRYPISLMINNYATVAFKGKINNKKTISIENGVNINEFNKKNLSKKKINFKNKLNLVFVANFNDQNLRHGLDRLIHGLLNYYKSKHKNKILIQLYIVGNMFAAKKIIQKIDNNSLLKNNIIHYNKLSKNKLFKLYSFCHVGIGNLAFHRIQVTHSSSLKEREYLSAFLPFVSASKDYCFNKNVTFRYRVASNDTPINFFLLTKFFKFCYNQKNLNNKIFQYTKSRLTWDITMQNLLSYIIKKKN